MHDAVRPTFTRDAAAKLIPKTNPFLRKLFQRIAANDLDDRVAWIADDTAQLLAQAQMADILAEFGKQTGKEDPVVHFYEQTQYFDSVPPEAWAFHVGGYQVCEKWLKGRKDRKLTIDDIEHYQQIVIALLETIRLMQAIDERIPGFPI